MGCDNCCTQAPRLVTEVVEPELDPAPCNGLSQGPNGLLAPQTDVVGIAPGGNIAGSRSVDIDVVQSGGCPNVFTVGARLTSVSADIGAASINLFFGAGFQATGAALVIPETGTYEVVSHGWGQICYLLVGGSTNVWITHGLQIDGVGVTWSDLAVQWQGSVDPGTNYQACHLGQGSITRRLQLAAGQVVRTVAALSGAGGPGAALQSATFNAPYIFFTKISD